MSRTWECTFKVHNIWKNLSIKRNIQSIKRNFENLKTLLEKCELLFSYNVSRKHGIQTLNNKSIQIFKLNLESFSYRILLCSLRKRCKNGRGGGVLIFITKNLKKYNKIFQDLTNIFPWKFWWVFKKGHNKNLSLRAYTYFFCFQLASRNHWKTVHPKLKNVFLTHLFPVHLFSTP